MLTDGRIGGSNSVSNQRSARALADIEIGFARLMTELGLDRHRSYVTALSGGADSSALALLTQRYANASGKTHHAVIIDHGLRNQSSYEADRVRGQMQIHGIASDVISIKGPRPKSGVQEWARLNRYRILLSVARDRQAVLLFAHNADDQAETIAMRLLKGSGITGLAGIPSFREQHGVTISRPLLSWSHDRLMLVCQHFNYAVEDDPSNGDRQFERVRIRQMLANLDRKRVGPSSDQLRCLGLISAKLHATASIANARSVGKAVEWHANGYATAVMEHLVGLSKFRWALMMRRLVMAISGNAYAPSRASLGELHNRIDLGLSATIGGCHFSPVNLEQVGACNDKKSLKIYRLFRETGRHVCTMSIEAFDEVVFAGCWLVKSQKPGLLLAFGDACRSGDGLDRTMICKNMPKEWYLMPHRARQAIPVLRTLDGGLIYPQLEGSSKLESGASLAARFVGMAKDQKFLMGTSTSASCA